MLDYQINESISRAYTESVCRKGASRGRCRSMNEGSGSNMLGVEPIDLMLPGNNAPTYPSFQEAPSVSTDEYRNFERKRAEEAEARRVANLTPEQREAERRATVEHYRDMLSRRRKLKELQAKNRRRRYYERQPVMTAAATPRYEPPRATISAGTSDINSPAYKMSKQGSPDQMLGDGVYTGLAVAAPGGGFVRGAKGLGKFLGGAAASTAANTAGKMIQSYGEKQGGRFGDFIKDKGELIEKGSFLAGLPFGMPGFVGSVVGDHYNDKFLAPKLDKKLGINDDDIDFNSIIQASVDAAVDDRLRKQNNGNGERTQSVYCPDCGKKFEDEDTMLKHAEFAHDEVTDEELEKLQKMIKSYNEKQ